MRVDLHNHTILCKHASGSVDEYIQKALELGIDVYGFSCHAPMSFDPNYRMALQELELYTNMIENAKQKYQSKIEILLGLEVDFIAGKENLIEKKVLEFKADYLIGSVHFLDEWGFDNPEFIAEYAKRDLKICWISYLEAIEKMAQSKLFEIIGHFDLLKIFNNPLPKSLTPYLLQTLKAIKDNQLTLEINAAGLRKPIAEQYPSKQILQYAYDLEIPITFGSDAHSPSQVGSGYEECIKLAKEVGYKNARIFRDKQPFWVEF